MHAHQPRRLTDLPLWRLLVALADAERVSGPDAPGTRELAEAVRVKLREENAPKRPAEVASAT
jgi:hypothetical protein